MTADDFRNLVLAMSGVIEKSHMGHPDFRANGRVFASLHSNNELGMVKLTPDEQRVILREHPDQFRAASGAWGRQGYTNVVLDQADSQTVRGAIVLAWENSAAATPRRQMKTTPRRTKPTTRRRK